MTHTFTCPNCSMPLDYVGDGQSVNCLHCGTTVIVPTEISRENTTQEITRSISDGLGISPDQPVEIKSHHNYGVLLFGMFLCGIAAIFPIIYIPMGITAWQAGIVPAAIAAFLGAFIWAICWAGIGAFIIYHLF